MCKSVVLKAQHISKYIFYSQCPLGRGRHAVRPCILGAERINFGRRQTLCLVVQRQNGQDLGHGGAQVFAHVRRPPGAGVERAVQSGQQYGGVGG